MKLKFEAKINTRFKNRMCGIEAVNYDWYWNYDLKEWTQNIEAGKYSYTSSRRCNSVRAFRRMIKTAPKGVQFKLWSRYRGCDVYGFGCA